MFEKLMLFMATFVVGLLLLFTIAGLLKKLLNVNIKVEGIMVWIMSAVLGWVFFRFTGMY